jgi:hypothetical protein
VRSLVILSSSLRDIHQSHDYSAQRSEWYLGIVTTQRDSMPRCFMSRAFPSTDSCVSQMGNDESVRCCPSTME